MATLVLILPRTRYGDRNGTAIQRVTTLVDSETAKCRHEMGKSVTRNLKCYSQRCEVSFFSLERCSNTG